MKAVCNFSVFFHLFVFALALVSPPLKKKYIFSFSWERWRKENSLYNLISEVNKMHVNVANSSGTKKQGLLCLGVLPVIPGRLPQHCPLSLPNTACSVLVTRIAPNGLTCSSSAEAP